MSGRAVSLNSVDKSRLRIWIQQVDVPGFAFNDSDSKHQSVLEAQVRKHAPHCAECLSRAIDTRRDANSDTLIVRALCGLQSRNDPCPDGTRVDAEGKLIAPVPATPPSDIPLSCGADVW